MLACVQEKTEVTLNFIPILNVNANKPSHETNNKLQQNAPSVAAGLHAVAPAVTNPVLGYLWVTNSAGLFEEIPFYQSGQVAATYKIFKGQPTYLQFVAKLFDASCKLIMSNSADTYWLATPALTASPLALPISQESLLTVGPLVFPPGAPFSGGVIGQAVTFTIQNGTGSLLEQPPRPNRAMRRVMRPQQEDVTSDSQSLTSYTGVSGEAVARLLNPAGAAGSTTVIKASLPFGPGVGTVNLQQTVTVTWRDPNTDFTAVTLAPAKAKYPVNDEVTLVAMIVNTAGTPVSDVRLHFVFVGDCKLVPDTELRHATTNATGQAVVRFTSLDPGRVVVVASTRNAANQPVLSMPSRIWFYEHHYEHHYGGYGAGGEDGHGHYRPTHEEEDQR